MAINRWEITGREEWLQRRRGYINGSEVGALFGASPFLTPYALYADKAGLADPGDKDNKAMKRGRVMEPSILAALHEDYPDWQIWKATDYLSCDDWGLGCTPDFYVTHPERGRGVIQGKTVAKPMFETEWADGPPLWVLLQNLLEMRLDDAKWGAVAAFVMSSYDYELHIFPFERHPEAEERIIVRAAEFWAAVKAGVVPKPDYAEDGEIIRALYRDGGAAPIDLSRHNRISFLCEEKLAWMKRASASEKALEVINSEITDILGDAERGDHPTFNITCKGQWSGGGSAPPRKKIRVLRVTRKKAAANDEGEDQQEAA